MNKNMKILIGGVVIIVVFAASYFYLRNQADTQLTKDQEEQAMMAQKEKQATVSAMKKEEKMMKSDTMTLSYKGKLIAGSNAPYLEFTKTDYDKAVAENKVIFLDFYANWCPICRAEAPDLKDGFNSLKTTNVVGFQVNWNDSDTDADENDLAKKYGVNYQHTKVIVKDGKVVFNEIVQWDKNQVVSSLDKY